MQKLFERYSTLVLEQVFAKPVFWLSIGFLLVIVSSAMYLWSDEQQETPLQVRLFLVGGFCLFAAAILFWLARIYEQLI